jgi:cob(I)alamin adenosyltransferase
MPIYTRTGDDGTTALFGGKRILKCEELVDAYGSIDELNSWLGLVASRIADADVQLFLYEIQKDLLLIGSVLAGWEGDTSILPQRVKKMEERIDLLDQNLPKLTNFVIPGGDPLASELHVTRAIARRTERQLVALSRHHDVDKQIFPYLNRLSDLLFILARFINKLKGVGEVVWSGDGKTKKQYPNIKK